MSQSQVQNRNRLHVQDDTPHVAYEGYDPPATEAAEDYTAVRVHVTNPVETTTGATQFGAYATIVIPPSSATAASVLIVLPHDPLRQYGYLTPLDGPIVISTELESAQSLANVGATVPLPAGAYIAQNSTTPPIRHNEAVYACNPSTSAACRVTVLVERGQTG